MAAMIEKQNRVDAALLALAALSMVAAMVLWSERRHVERELGDLEAQRQQLSRELASLTSANFKERQADADASAVSELMRLTPKAEETVRRLENPRFANRGTNRVDGNYAPLFRALGLSDAKLERLRPLLAQRLIVVPEANQLAAAEGLALEDLPDRKQIVESGAKEIDAAIASELGPECYKTFQAYQSSLNARRYLVGPFADHLSFGVEPLSDAQVDALAAAASQADFGINEIVPRPPGPEIPAGLDSVAASVLSPAQQQAYLEYKDVWAATRRKAQLDLEFYIKRQAAATAHAP